MIQTKHGVQPDGTGLDMDLALARRACEAQLPALAARRLRAHHADISALQDAATRSLSAQRLARKLFSLMANAAVHCGGADTLRPLFEHCALVRTFLWLRARVHVTAPEPLVRGTPDLVVDAGGESVWVDTRVRSPEVIEERGRLAVLVVDRTQSMRREPPLRLGEDYAGEFHLLDTRAPEAASEGSFVLEQQPSVLRGSQALALARAAGASGRRASPAEAGLEHSA